MFPHSASPYLPNKNVTHAKFFRAIFTRESRLPVIADDRARLRFRDLIQRMFGSVTVSSFREHIQRIVFRGTYKQMGRADTRRIITAMQNEFTYWYRSLMYNPRNAMCAVAFHRPKVHSAMPHLVCVACPDPASIRFPDMRPENFFDTPFSRSHRPGLYNIRRLFARSF